MKRRVGSIPWVMLFLTVFLVNYLWMTIGIELEPFDLPRRVSRLISSLCFVLLCLGAGSLPIMYYRIPRRSPIHGVIFFAAVGGMFFASLSSEQYSFSNGLVVLFLLLGIVIQAAYLLGKAQSPYSKKAAHPKDAPTKADRK